MDNPASVVTAVSLIVVAVTQFYTARWARMAMRTALSVANHVEAVHADVSAIGREVETGNGKTIGMLADIAEGRAAQAIPEADRTASEQEHADMKEASDNAGPQ